MPQVVVKTNEREYQWERNEKSWSTKACNKKLSTKQSYRPHKSARQISGWYWGVNFYFQLEPWLDRDWKRDTCRLNAWSSCLIHSSHFARYLVTLFFEKTFCNCELLLQESTHHTSSSRKNLLVAYMFRYECLHFETPYQQVVECSNEFSPWRQNGRFSSNSNYLTKMWVAPGKKSLDWFHAVFEKYIERLPRLLRSRRWTENGRNEAVFAGVSLALQPKIFRRKFHFSSKYCLRSCFELSLQGSQYW